MTTSKDKAADASDALDNGTTPKQPAAPEVDGFGAPNAAEDAVNPQPPLDGEQATEDFRDDHDHGAEVRENVDRTLSDESVANGAPPSAPPADPRPERPEPAERSGRSLAMAALVVTILTLIALVATIALGAVYLLPALQQGSERAGSLRSDIAETSRDVDRVGERIAALDQRVAERSTRLQNDIDGAKRSMQADVDTVRRAMENFGATMSTVRAEQATALAELRAGSAQRDAAIHALNERVAGGQRGWQLNELEHLLLIGNERLQLANDLDGALAALQFADGRIGVINDPALTPTREALTAEIAALKSTPRVDRQRLALRLGTLIDQVATLPIDRDIPSMFEPDKNNTSQAGQAAAEAGARAWESIKQAMSKTFTVRPADAPAAPLLPPDQEYFLRQNLLLKLETARLAVLQGDSANFSEALRGARNWITEYFDPNAASVSAAIELIDDVSGMPVAQTRPDISGSLAKLRAVMSDRSR